MNPAPSTMPPKKPVNRIALIAWILFFAAVTIVPSVYFLIWPGYVRSELLKNGLQAEGTIVRIEPTGTVINSQPEARITIDVRPAGSAPFQAEAKMVVNPLYAPLYQPGKRVLVRYDKDDHTKMTIEYTEER